MTKEFLTGNQAVIKGAIASGALMMTGYPITPTTEIMESWAQEFVKNDKLKFLQTEDEMAAGFAMIGGVLAGIKAFSATAGPGNTLMQDAFSMAENMRLPTVSFINQRGGPSTGTVIYSQQEVMLTCFGGNGEGLRIVYSIANPQEMYDYAIRAFNTAWKYRFPTFVLSDGYSAKTQTEIEIYEPREKNIEEVSSEKYLLNENKDKDTFVNLRNTYNLESELNKVLIAHHEAFEKASLRIVESSDYQIQDAEIVVFAHGIVAEAARQAVDILRNDGKKVGMFRPITLNPFPKVAATKAVENKKMIFIAESSLGQLEKIVKSNLYGLEIPIKSMKRPAMGIMPEEIAEEVKKLEV